MKRLLLLIALLPMMAVEVFAQTLKGDVNRDGTVDISDVVKVVDIVLNGTQEYTLCPDNNHPHLIDLGLPSGTKWACCNVGASVPEGAGNYYSWGETETKDVFTWSTYSLCNGSSSTCEDLWYIGESEHDVAFVKWKDSWKMPSFLDFLELADYCDYQYTSINDISGVLFKGSNGNSVFLPFDGFMNGNTKKHGREGFYWTSSPNLNEMQGVDDYSTAFYCWLNNNNVNSEQIAVRYLGYQVRPIQYSSGLIGLTDGVCYLSKGNTMPMDIYDGSGFYDVFSEDNRIVTAEADENVLNITACGEGSTRVFISDNVTGRYNYIFVSVTDESSNKPQISSTGVSLTLGSRVVVTVTSGSGKYEVINPAPFVAEASISGNAMTINAVDIGAVVIRIKDKETGLTNDINVIVTGLPSFVNCPDDHHPHLIDLGLPSGTKWACCNVGALSPSDYGLYFAWGETEAKSEYSLSTYKYYNSSTGYTDIGNNGCISGNVNYDPACKYWGGTWQMPVIDDIFELFECTSEWTEVNGVKGCKITGPNGGSIFLPAAGRFVNDKVDACSVEGEYTTSEWISSNIGSDIIDSRLNLFFENNENNDPDRVASITGARREMGIPLRPVSR